MRFFGGFNRRGSIFFRRQSRTLAVLELSNEEVIVSFGGRFTFLFDEPSVWKVTDLEFNRQPRRINSWVGLRRRGEDEWSWFHTISFKQLCTGLASVGATEVVAPPLRTKDLFPITLPGLGLVAGAGIVLLSGALWFLSIDAAEARIFAGSLQAVGALALALGCVSGVVHLWGRR